MFIVRFIICLFWQVLLTCYLSSAVAGHPVYVPILTYHNFDPSVPGKMTISTAKFRSELQWLKDNGYTVIPLMKLVDYLHGNTDSLPEKSVVITADDGRESVYTYMLPLVREYKVPVTLFIYPSAISNAKYALTWQQLKELKNTGYFDIQDHTYWHPNFNEEKRNLSTSAYQKLVEVQLVKSKEVLEKKLGIKVTLLAWPYGIYDKYLESQAAKAGYSMSFSIDDRSANKAESNMAQPRYMVAEKYGMKTFAEMVDGTIARRQK